MIKQKKFYMSEYICDRISAEANSMGVSAGFLVEGILRSALDLPNEKVKRLNSVVNQAGKWKQEKKHANR
jgi:hypothetical protein